MPRRVDARQAGSGRGVRPPAHAADAADGPRLHRGAAAGAGAAAQQRCRLRLPAGQRLLLSDRLQRARVHRRAGAGPRAGAVHPVRARSRPRARDLGRQARRPCGRHARLRCGRCLSRSPISTRSCPGSWRTARGSTTRWAPTRTSTAHARLGERPARRRRALAATRRTSSLRSSTCCTTCGSTSRAASLSLMREAANIAARAHVRAMKRTPPGRERIRAHGGAAARVPACSNADTSYQPIVGGGANACILHYRENNQTLNDGDLLLVDAGCEYQCYASDITRTWPVNGALHARAARGVRGRAGGQSRRDREGAARAITGTSRTRRRCAS